MRDVEAIVRQARGEAERLKTEAAANLDAAFARREKMAMDKIAQAEAQAIADVRNHAIDVAVAAAEQLLKSKTDAARGERLIDSAICGAGAEAELAASRFRIKEKAARRPPFSVSDLSVPGFVPHAIGAADSRRGTTAAIAKTCRAAARAVPSRDIHCPLQMGGAVQRNRVIGA